MSPPTPLALTPDKLVVLVAWFETAELPLAPFRSAPWVEVHEPEAWRAVVLAELRGEPAGVYWNTALTGVRWLARQFAPPEVQAAAHAAELVQRQEVRPQHLISTKSPPLLLEDLRQDVIGTTGGGLADASGAVPLGPMYSAYDVRHHGSRCRSGALGIR